MKSRLRIVRFCLLGSFLVHSTGAFSQEPWTPITAKLRETYQVLDKDGRILSTEVKEGYFYRNSEGSTLQYWASINGDESRGGSGKLRDNRAVAEFSLNMKTKVAVRLPKEAGEESQRPDFLAGARSSKLGQEAVEGIVCYKTPVTLTESNKPPREIGRACQAPDYGLTLKFDVVIVSPDGQSHRTSRELYDIRVGEAPDPKLFQLKPSFQILSQE